MACQPCTKSRRAIQARFVICIQCQGRLHQLHHSGVLTDRTPSPCSPPILFALSSDQYTTSRAIILACSQGNSSSRFSKYLLPNLSFAINVPALVSPTTTVSVQFYEPQESLPYPCTRGRNRRSVALLSYIMVGRVDILASDARHPIVVTMSASSQARN